MRLLTSLYGTAVIAILPGSVLTRNWFKRGAYSCYADGPNNWILKQNQKVLGKLHSNV